MGLSNNITAFLTFMALLCSIPILASGVWLATTSDAHCVRLLRLPLILLGLGLLLVSLAGFVGAHWNRRRLLILYLVATAALIVLLLTLLVFAFVVTKPDGAYDVPGRGYKEYRLQGYAGWLRENVVGDGNWGRIQACLAESGFCGKLAGKYAAPGSFFTARLTPLESGCCKPPTVCGYAFVSPTMWINPSNPVATPDCYAWSNDQSQLCYGCDSCKAGLLGNLRSEWRKANIALIIATVVLIFVYIIGCCALKNAQTEELFRRYKQGYV